MFTKFVIFSALLMQVPLLCNGGYPTDWFSPTQKEQKKNSAADADEFTRMRRRMVKVQLQGRDIRDVRVLAAMGKVPRHEFVPSGLASSAYNDGALPLGMGQTISQPYIVAYMTQLLELKGTERVLEIGTGSGYQAAILAEIVPEVYTIEILPELGEQAADVLGRLVQALPTKLASGCNEPVVSRPLQTIINAQTATSAL